MNNKNTDKLKIEWPTNHFTIQDIQQKYPNAKNITLRFRINKAIEQGKLTYIGKNDTDVGRPTIVLSPCPVTADILKSAVECGVIIDEKYVTKQPVQVVQINTSTVDTSNKTKSETKCNTCKC